MEECLRVEVQISSYDAKGLQCFVSEEYRVRQNCSLH